MNTAAIPAAGRLDQIALASLGVAVLVLAIKFAAWWVTGSVALYSDALESIVNVGTAGAAYIAIRIAAIPPDAEHPYGHHKAEYLSAVLVGSLIVVAAISILNEAWAAFQDPKVIDAPLAGIAISVLATVLNGAWSWFLLRTGKRRRSAALSADGQHLLADVVTSVAVIAGVALVVVTGILVLDAVIAAIVSLNVLWSGWKVISRNVSGLLDEAAPKAELDAIRQIIAANGGSAIQAHALRTRHAGRITFIEFHLVVDGRTSVAEAHDICDRIEVAIKSAIADAVVSIHVEPEHKAKREAIAIT